MSIDSRYFEDLKHFGKTVTVQELAQNISTSNLIALRHDIDYDLDLVLEMSYWEKDKSIRSSYYLLHTAQYFQDPRFHEKCLQIQDFDHEIGLHLNVLSEWITRKVSDIQKRIKELVSSFQEARINITGVSPHSDKLCCKYCFINYWCFNDFKPSKLELEQGLSTERIPIQESKFRIKYKQSLTRTDVLRLSLSSVSMKDCGISYEAIHTPHDYYYTDPCEQ